MTKPRCLASRLAIVLCASCAYAVLLSSLAGCVAADEPQGRGSESAAHVPARFSDYDADIHDLVGRMTLEEKIGQMTQAELGHLGDLTDIQKYFIGSVLSGGGSDPEEGNGLEAWTDVFDRCQRQALATRLGIPMLYGIDAVHGHSNVLGAVIFPHNIGLGCTRNADLVEEVSRVAAAEVRATGIQWTFAPCVTVPQDERWGRTYEGFSEDPQISSELGAAAVRGFQGKSLSNPLSVLACAKHYAGDGGTSYGTGQHGNKLLDQGDTRVDEATLRRIHIYPYPASIKAGVGTIMPSYNSWNGEKVTGSKFLLTDVLKDELGFEGFLISDYNAIDQVNPSYKEAVKQSVNAGIDMAMAPNSYKKFFNTLKELVEEGEVPMARIDDAVTRILRVKYAMGLLDKNRSQLADRKLHTSFGSPQHREVARKAVRQSLVLLKNDDQTLPLAKQLGHIHVAGRGADDIGIQCGGWTIEWQGKSGEVTPGGTTILTAIKNAVADETIVTFSQDGSGAAGADVAVVVVGETPYAEGNGDDADLALADEDVQAVRTLHEAGVPVVVILISGRPMMLEGVLDEADALVAAWLPGTEGDGVADVLFGDYAPTGKLSFTWPRSVEQLPINVGDENYDPLFPFGYGLTYGND